MKEEEEDPPIISGSSHLFISNKIVYIFQYLCDNDHPDQPLEYLMQSQTRPQAQVGPEEVKGVHEAELVQGGLPYPDLVIKVETDHRCIATFERHRGRHLLPDGGRGTETG